MSPTPGISIIIPAYNAEKYIGECLSSVISQTGEVPDYEVIVVDDASTDDTADIVSSVRGGIRMVSRTTNGGLSVARNDGIAKARGEYVLFVDSDDRLAPDALSRLWAHVRLHPGVDIVYGTTESFPNAAPDARYFDLYRSGAKPYDDDSDSVRRVHLRLPEIAQNRLIRRKWLVDNGLTFRPGQIHEDFEWHIRAYDLIGSYAIETERPTYYYRRHDNSITGSESRVDRMRAVYSILADRIPGLRAIDRPAMRFIAHNLLEFKGVIDTAADRRLFDAVCDAITDRADADRRMHRAVRLFRAYNRAFPLRLYLLIIP